jgi:von Willebrand factor type A domain
MPKYFSKYGSSTEGSAGPNRACMTKAITPLTDVSTESGKSTIIAAINAMQSSDTTNVPEGMAWGWRTVSSGQPFTQGRPETEKGNDKVVIVVTDGANTYFTPDSLQAIDSANNKSTYNAYGYAKLIFKQSGFASIPLSRIFQGTSSSIPKTTYTNANYTNAMNEHFKALCDNAKAKKIMVMTVALDLNASKAAEKTQIDLLKACASDSRYRKDGQGKPAKLFWNSTGASLSEDFRKIGDELSNLRIVG